MDIATILPPAVDWVKMQEANILTHGQPLDDQIKKIADAIGIANADEVRFLKVKNIPRPSLPMLNKLCQDFGLITPNTIGLTMGRGIYFREDAVIDKELMAHELKHIEQYERFKGVEGFLTVYLNEIFTLGYEKSPLEIEARKTGRFYSNS